MRPRIVRFALVGLALLLAASHLEAQRRTARGTFAAPMTFAIGGGVTLPTGDLGDAVSTGYHVEGMAARRLRAAPLTLRAEAAYNDFGAKESKTQNGNRTITTSSDAHTLSLTLNAIYDFRTTMAAKPYLIGGMGSYDAAASTTTNGTTTSDSQWKFGGSIGGGFRLVVHGKRAFVEARYHKVDQAAYMPISFGVQF